MFKAFRNKQKPNLRLDSILATFTETADSLRRFKDQENDNVDNIYNQISSLRVEADTKIREIAKADNILERIENFIK